MTLDGVYELKYPESFEKNEYRLLELRSELLEAFENKEQLEFRGLENDAAVLVTAKHTFLVKDNIVSNTMLLTDLSDGIAALIVDEMSSAWHCEVIAPKLGRLYQLLKSRSVFSGKPVENPVSLGEIKSCVQASDYEIRDALNRWGALEMDGGSVYLLEDDYVIEAVEYLLTVLKADGWSYGQTMQYPAKDVEEESFGDEYPLPLMKHLYFMLQDLVTEQLNLNKLGTVISKAVLKQYKGSRVSMEIFLQCWFSMMDKILGAEEDLEFDEVMLKGLAVIQTATYDKERRELFYFPEDELPFDVDLRIQALFEVKSLWKLEEIVPYLEPILEKKHISAALAKSARVINNVDGSKEYCSKYHK